jgi:hypothetical protein
MGDKEDAIEEKWSFVLQHEQEPIRRIATEAARHPTLRRLFPFASHNDLHFSRVVVYPFDELPFVLTTPFGVHEARDFDNRPIGTGDLPEVVRLVAEAIGKREP